MILSACDRRGPWSLKATTQPTHWPANMWQMLQEAVTLPLKHRERHVQLAHLFHLTKVYRDRTRGTGFKLKESRFRCLIPESVAGQTGWGSEKPGLVAGVLELNDLQGLF